MSDAPSLPPNIDLDRFVGYILKEIQRASQGWANGHPKDEVAFLNRLTEVMCRKRRGCDVGINQRVKVETKSFLLHRKGTNQQDEFGSDLAVTLNVEESWWKTAFFQLKKSKLHQVSLNHDDLKGARQDPRIASRSFVLVVDEDRLGIRIGKTNELVKKIKAGKNSASFDTSEWLTLTDWLRKWLRCELSPASDPSAADAVEGLLTSFLLPEYSDEDLFDFEPDGRPSVRKAVPAQTWIQASAQVVIED